MMGGGGKEGPARGGLRPFSLAWPEEGCQEEAVLLLGPRAWPPPAPQRRGPRGQPRRALPALPRPPT